MNKKIVTIVLCSMLACARMQAADYSLRDLDSLTITKNEKIIAEREFKFSLARKGIQLGSAALVVVGMISLYRWSKSGVVVPHADMAMTQATVNQIKASVKEVDIKVENTQILVKTMQGMLANAQVDKATKAIAVSEFVETIKQKDHVINQKDIEIKNLHIDKQKLTTELKKPFLTGIPGGLAAWVKYIFESSVIGTAVASGAYVIAQHGLPKIFSCLDYVFYTFSYHWFVKNRTEMVSCFEELERAAYAYDNQTDQVEYQRRIFIWAFNQLLTECEYTLAFMHVQNNYLLQYSIVHGRHMAVITKHFKQVIEHHKQMLGTVEKVPEGYATWTDFVKAYRDKLRIEGESYAQNEQYIFSRLTAHTIGAR